MYLYSFACIKTSSDDYMHLVEMYDNYLGCVDSFIIDSRTMHNKYQWQWAFNEQLLIKYMLYTYTHITNCEILNINKVIDD